VTDSFFVFFFRVVRFLVLLKMASEEKKVEAVHSGMDVVLHPLVVISVSDQYTRKRLVTPPGGKVCIIGVLLGMPKNGKIEITNSFDIVADFDPSSGKLVKIDEPFLHSRLQAFTTVFPATTVVGWYESGSSVDTDDAAIIARILSKKVDTLFAMTFDGEAAYDKNATDIPIELFEAELKGEEPKQTVSLKKTPYHIITIEAERIGVDHIAKSSITEGCSQLTVHVLGMQGAMKMLYSRIEVISEYLKKVNEGSVPFDHDIMRKIGVLHDLLCAAQSPDFDKRFFFEYNDEMLLAYLSSLTEGLQTMNSMADTHAVSYSLRKETRAPRAPREPTFF